MSDEPVSGVDLLPTACALAGINPPADRTLDGANVLPVVDRKPVDRATPLYWHFNRASDGPKVAMRVGDWKILATLDKPPVPARTNDIVAADERRFKEAELDEFFLYNLKADIGETTDLAATRADKLAELKPLIEAKYKEVRGESPVWPAWKFPGVEGKLIVWPEYSQPPTRKK